MFIIFNHSAIAACPLAPFSRCHAIFRRTGENKKTPTYAEYVERHQKHNMKIFSIF